MSVQTFKVHFILKMDKTNKKGLTPIFARIRLNGIKMELSTNRNIAKANWSVENQIAFPIDKFSKDLNQFLENFKSKIYNGYTMMLSSGEAISAELLKQSIYGKPLKRRYGLIETAIQHNEEFEKQIGKKYSYGSYKNYKTTLKYLFEFVPAHFKTKDISLEMVDYKFCEKYFIYLTTLKSCNINGASKHIQRIKKIINYAVRLGYLRSSLMTTYVLRINPPKKYPLSIEEINALASLNLQRKTLVEVRDIFVFQCYTGLSYSDIKGLKHKHIHKEGNDDIWIKMERQKTEISFSVPLLQPALVLLKKYTDLGEFDFVFPVLSNQKMNENLKVLQEIAGISKNLTTHLARHTFATTITLNNDVPIETVSRMLGHTSIKTTQLYAKVLDVKIGSDMRKLGNKLKE